MNEAGRIAMAAELMRYADQCRMIPPYLCRRIAADRIMLDTAFGRRVILLLKNSKSFRKEFLHTADLWIEDLERAE